MNATFKIALIFFITVTARSYGQDNNYFVALCSHAVNTSSYGGHAFIAIGKGDPFTCSVDGTETEVYGLYAQDDNKPACVPSSFDAAKSCFVGPLPGCIFNDTRTQVDNILVIRCSVDRYFQILGVISTWTNKKYELSVQDCLTFVQVVASNFSFLQIPPRSGTLNYPNQFVLELLKENGKDLVDQN